MAKLETRVSGLEARAALHEREVAAIRKLFIQGAKILVKIEQRQADTDKALNRLIHSLERGGTNGHNGKK